MVWIKRNLGFVISAVVGLLLTGYCSYLLFNSLAHNKEINDDYQTTKSNLEQLQNSPQFPSKENIQAARDDQAHERKFLAEFRTRFAPFPVPPAEDEKGFRTYLDDSLVRFRAEATNAEVQVTPGYAFSFSGPVGKLNYPLANIPQWMEQLQEISTILHIVYDAKVNALSFVKRVPVSTDDATMGDCLQAASVTNQWGIVTPYQIAFHGFSGDLASVLEGFARSSNCFIIKTVTVVTDPTAMPTPSQATPQAPAYRPAYPAQTMRPRGGLESLLTQAGRPRSPTAVAPAVQVPASAAFSGPPITILSETPLLVTITVDLVKLKATEP